MHNWGDDGVDWEGINNAAQFIADYCRRWARLGGTSKEKYGTVRFYASFRSLSLHDIVYPGYHWYQWPMWARRIDDLFEATLGRLLRKPWAWWQRRIYRQAYQKAVLRWPHLRQEILCCADYDELLESLR